MLYVAYAAVVIMVRYDSLRWSNIRDRMGSVSDAVKGRAFWMAFGAVFFGGIYLAADWRNNVLNNQTINTSSSRTVSYVHGGLGHIEYTVSKSDDSQDVKIVPKSLNIIGDTEFDQDFNGDGLVDIIRINKGEYGYNRLMVHSREDANYDSKVKVRFDKADARLQELMGKYPRE